MSHVNTSNRYSAKKRAYAETSAREWHANDRAGHERPPPVETDPDDNENFDDWERTHDHSPARMHARDEAHAVRNPNHPEGRSTTDLSADRERRRSNDISLAIRENKRRKKSAVNDDLEEIHHATRFIPRTLGPFLNITKTILDGVRLDYHSRTPSDRPISLTDDERELLKTYRKIIRVIPTLESRLRYAIEHRTSELAEFATYDVPHIDRKAKKEQRGFCHFVTARLLCPRQLRDEFDIDMEGFCRDVQNGRLVITHDDWPSFLYPEDMYDPDALDEHLMRGPFLLSCYRHLFTGPRTGSKTTPGKAPGKKCIANLYKMREVLPESIAYVAVLCRHVLNAKELWSIQDGSFHADAFFQNILDLFDDQEWAEETLKWWNGQVFGDTPRPQENAHRNSKSGVARLAEQCAARRAYTAAQAEED